MEGDARVRTPRWRSQPPSGDGVEALIGESTLESVTGLGASLAVTATRVVVIRDRAEHRPRTGLRSWSHGEVDARLEPPRGGHGRIVLGTGANPYAAVSLVVPTIFWPVAVKAVERIRAEARRVRRTSRPHHTEP